MPYSNDDIRELYQKICQSIMNSNKYGYKITSLEDLQKEPKWKEVNFQDKCEGGHSLGDLLLKSADENDNLRVREFFLKNGFELPEEEKEQNTPDVEESRADSNEVGSSNSKDTQFITLYSSDGVRNLYLKIDKIIKQKPQISLKELSKELNIEIDLKQKFHNGHALGDLLLALAIEKSNLDFIKFLFKNELKIINIVSQQEGTYHISKTRDGRAVLGHAIYSGNAEVLNLLLQNIDVEQLKLEPESELYKQCQLLKDNALFTAVEKSDAKAVKLLIASGANPEAQESGREGRRVLNMAMDNKKNEELVTLLLSAETEEKQEKQKAPNVEGNIEGSSRSNGNADNRSVATVPPVSTNGDNNKNETLVSTRSGPTTAPNSGKGTNSFTNPQFSPQNEQETKYKESTKDFYTSLAKDVVGVVITGLFITAAVMVPSVAGAVVCSVAATLIAIVTGLHIASSTLPSYREMRENKVECVNSNLLRISRS